MTKRMRRGKRKLQVLQYVRDHPETTSEDIARDLGLEIHNARMLLLKYHRQGLLNRHSFARGLWKVYDVTTKGLRRIDWLLERMVVNHE